MLVRTLTCAALLGGSLTVMTSGHASTDTLPSYEVICVERTLPHDPEPYKVCVPYPL